MYKYIKKQKHFICVAEWIPEQTGFTLDELMFVEVLRLSQEERRKLLQEK